MRLQREEAGDVATDTTEYKSAVKSVIRCQIQALLQKLASETGEESIVISTNATTGTYNHLGSYMGREYLQDSDASVQTICQKFMVFCAGMQNKSVAVSGDSMTLTTTQDAAGEQPHQILKMILQQNTEKGKGDNSVQKTPEQSGRKRLLDVSPKKNLSSSPSKRPAVLIEGQPGRKTDTLTIRLKKDEQHRERGDNSGILSWIKTEPQESLDTESETHAGNNQVSMQATSNGNHGYQTDTTDANEKDKQVEIKRMSRSLIPLASIYNKFGKIGKNDSEKLTLEAAVNCSSRDGDISPSLSTGKLQIDEEAGLKLPATSCDSGGVTENPVLSGYYDSDNYRNYDRKPKSINIQKSKPDFDATDLPAAPADPVPKMTDSPGRLVYECYVCHRELSHLTSYRRHMKIHTLDRPHKCPVCGKGFIRKYHCLHHLNKHHKGVEYDLDSSSQARSHSPIDASDQSLVEIDQSAEDKALTGHLYNSPLIFDQSGSSVSDLNQSGSSLPSVKTEPASSSESSPGELTRAKQDKNKSSISDTFIPENLRKIADVENMGCILCNKNFPSMNSLLRHLYTHSAGQTFTCEICDTEFNKKHLYTSHVVSEHGMELA